MPYTSKGDYATCNCVGDASPQKTLVFSCTILTPTIDYLVAELNPTYANSLFQKQNSMSCDLQRPRTETEAKTSISIECQTAVSEKPSSFVNIQ